MFRSTEGVQPEILKKETDVAEKNYVIQRNDYLKLDIYSNNGERLIDPNPDMSGASVKSSSNNNAQQPGQTGQTNDQASYFVDTNGIVKLPMIGEIKLEGLNLRQAEEVVQKEYAKFFKEPFVKISYANKRVIVLGAPGGQVIPLTNQNVSVAEVLALAKGIDNFAKAQNIKLIRGTHVYQIDFSTIKGFKEGNLIVEPGDIVYVEPIRRPFSEALRDNYMLFYVFVLTFTTVIANRIK
ncbi:MAG TPA: polysaccharide export protein EpsE [Cytophagales bacterium]|jgi:polysaccharide biosynthesis/export protein|nr:polysaccharide export protein EpsE [Cytophagales bacterium]